MDSKHKKILLVIIGVLLVLVLALGGLLLFQSRKAGGPVTNYQPGGQSFEFEDEQQQEIREASTGAGIEIPGYSVIPIRAGSTEISVDLFNPDQNQVYFQIALVLTDTDEQIYESKLIKPGQHLYDITLTRALEPGEYPTTIRYSTFSMDGEFTPRNGADVECILRAE